MESFSVTHVTLNILIRLGFLNKFKLKGCLKFYTALQLPTTITTLRPVHNSPLKTFKIEEKDCVV